MSASADSQFSQRMFSLGLGGVTHPLLADFHPKGAVAISYGVYNETTGFPKRALFIIDRDGVVRYSREYSTGLPDVDEVLSELDKVIKG